MVAQYDVDWGERMKQVERLLDEMKMPFPPKDDDEDDDEIQDKQDSDSDDDDSEDEDSPGGLFARLNRAADDLKTLIKSWSKPDKPYGMDKPFTLVTKEMKEAFPSLKDYDWIGWYSNNFKDREDEIISEYAISQYVSKVQRGEIPPPELWWLHIAGTKHGVAKNVWHVGHFVVAAGVFDSEESNPLVKRLKLWYADNEDVTMSHGFLFEPALKINNTYYAIETYEISATPHGTEANPYTKFEVAKAIDMGVVTDQQRTLLEQTFGKDFADSVVGRADTFGEQLRSQGVQFKSLPEAGSKEDGFSPENLLMLSAIADMQNTILSNIKQDKDTANQLEQTHNMIGDLGDKIYRLTEAIADLTKRRAPTQSDSTKIPDNDPHADFIQEKNEKGSGQPVSVFQQMKMGSGVVGTQENNPNGGQ